LENSAYDYGNCKAASIHYIGCYIYRLHYFHELIRGIGYSRSNYKARSNRNYMGAEMSLTKRFLHLVELDTKKIVLTYTWEEYDEITGEDDPFVGEYSQNLISGRAQAQSQRDEATTDDSTRTLPEAR